jgi:hypothetical protein
MLKAAELWAKARQQGKPTADNQALDGDVILASQALALKNNIDYEVIIATSNKKHLSLFTEAEDWQNI